MRKVGKQINGKGIGKNSRLFSSIPFFKASSSEIWSSAAYFRMPSVILTLQKCGAHIKQKRADFAPSWGSVSSWNLLWSAELRRGTIRHDPRAESEFGPPVHGHDPWPAVRETPRRTIKINRGDAGQMFWSAGSDDFPLVRRHAGLESPATRQAGKAALQQCPFIAATPDRGAWYSLALGSCGSGGNQRRGGRQSHTHSNTIAFKLLTGH